MSWLIRAYCCVEPDVSSPLHALSDQAEARLIADGASLAVCAQNLFEFWVVASRPAAVNGLGLSPAEARALVDEFRVDYMLLVDPQDVVDRWLDLVTLYQVTGKPAHDARLVAVMLANGVAHILTFNAADFTRYTGIVVVDPRDPASFPP